MACIVVTCTASMPNEAWEGGQGHGQEHGGTVRVGDYGALAGLLPDQFEVIGIDLRYDQGNVGVHAMILRVGNDHVPRIGETGFRLAGYRAVQP
jgi:hypothetical protein